MTTPTLAQVAQKLREAPTRAALEAAAQQIQRVAGFDEQNRLGQVFKARWKELQQAHKFSVGDHVKSRDNKLYTYVVLKVDQMTVDVAVKESPAVVFKKMRKHVFTKVEQPAASR